MANDADHAERQRVPRAAPLVWAVTNTEEIIAGAGLLVVVAAVSWGVFTRYLTHQPATWTSEVGTIAFARTVFIGASAAFKHGGHVSIDMLVMFLPGALRSWLQSTAEFVVVIFCIAVSVLAMMSSITNWDNPTSVLRLPVSTSYLPVSVGFGLMAIRQVHATWMRYRGAASAV